MSDPALPDPSQRELALDDARPMPALAAGPWQIELAWRIVLNTGITVVAIGSRWVVDATAMWLLGDVDWMLAILIGLFRVVVLPVAIIGVVGDFARFVARRAPKAWIDIFRARATKS